MSRDKEANETDLIDKLDTIFDNKILQHKVAITERWNRHLLTIGGIVLLGLNIFAYFNIDSKVDTSIAKLNSKSEELTKQVADDKAKINDLLNKLTQAVQKADLSCFIENRELANSEVTFNSPNETKYIMIQNSGSKVVEWAKAYLYVQDKLMPSLKPDHQWEAIIPSDEVNYTKYLYSLEGGFSLMLLSPNEKMPLTLRFIAGQIPSQSPQTLEAILKIYYGEGDTKIIPFKLKFKR